MLFDNIYIASMAAVIYSQTLPVALKNSGKVSRETVLKLQRSSVRDAAEIFQLARAIEIPELQEKLG
jgi:hypothetical protein